MFLEEKKDYEPNNEESIQYEEYYKPGGNSEDFLMDNEHAVDDESLNLKQRNKY